MIEIALETERFVLKEDGREIGELTFAPVSEETLVVDHTYVAETHRGQGHAERLVERVVQYARETNRRIVPSCSYVYALFRRNSAYQDVWQKDR